MQRTLGGIRGSVMARGFMEACADKSGYDEKTGMQFGYSLETARTWSCTTKAIDSSYKR